MLKPILLCAAFGAVFGSGLAYTQSAPATAPSVSMKHPGYLEKIEERFRTADKNGDGALTREEAKAAGLDRIVQHFDRIDANKDGKVTIDELRDALRSRARIPRISS
ncbi:MAG TPA: EF-hand domain-containing protein [Noviherbaspirillum sp.]|jgi:Ca2+-binding EF-hand superfamily protein